MGTIDIAARDRLLRERPVPNLNRCLEVLRASELSKTHKEQMRSTQENANHEVQGTQGIQKPKKNKLNFKQKKFTENKSATSHQEQHDVDYYSDYFELDHLQDTSSNAVIEATKIHFARHGIADIVTPYTSQEFDQFSIFVNLYIQLVRLYIVKVMRLITIFFRRYRKFIRRSLEVPHYTAPESNLPNSSLVETQANNNIPTASCNINSKDQQPKDCNKSSIDTNSNISPIITTRSGRKIVKPNRYGFEN
ncbi:hypothetical protein LOTGIDRAFT_153946 [Lottia gigantea]|uniref:Uncharacterized protein n=1 Tax=Lottia gigantea TaxID=225164 RepID=V4BRJ3_LOTGI|nr:hypothetical protein LOTGIDRAFT_153946 [Lottia gigantea]ESO91504.1 hypothetical protein LOTGIDRAFT_153946 [Lottia gigantea]